MQTWIALLRGINVGGKSRLPMKDLSAILEGLGCSQVQTYIQSGNAVFRSPKRNAAQLSRAIGAAVKAKHSFEPQVILLTLKEFDKATASNPFREAEAEPKSLHLFFMSEKPTSPNLERLEALSAELERFELHDKVLYLHAPNGIGRSKLAANLEKLIGVPMTGRNWRSIQKIAGMAREVE